MNNMLSHREFLGRLLDGHVVVDSDGRRYKMFNDDILCQSHEQEDWKEAAYFDFNCDFYDDEEESEKMFLGFSAQKTKNGNLRIEYAGGFMYLDQETKVKDALEMLNRANSVRAK